MDSITDKHFYKFWAHVDAGGPEECWLWDGPIADNWHGYFTCNSRPIGAYRLAYLFTHGAISSGLIICHRCHEGQCVNPHHLYAGTPADNARDRAAVGQRWKVYPALSVREWKNSRLLTPRRVQHSLGIGGVALRRLRDTNTLTPYRTPHATWAYKASEVELLGASRSAVERLLNNTIKQVPLDDLAALCRWVPCEVGEILVLEEHQE